MSTPEQQTVNHLSRVMRGGHFSLSLEKESTRKVKVWVLGVLRRFFWYQFCCDRLVKKADSRTKAYIMHAMFRLDDEPEKTAILTNALVDEAKKMHLSGGMVNAVLRRYMMDKASLSVKSRGVVSIQYNLRPSLLDRVRASHENWKEVLKIMGEKPEICLAVNTTKVGNVQFENALVKEEVSFQREGMAYRVRNTGKVQNIPGFDQGWFMVISASNQEVASLLPDISPKRILDACAAPGGKSFLLRKHYGENVSILATDSDESRMARLKENNTRLDLSLDIQQADWERGGDFGFFDLIWADVPCSASGVIAKHPEIAITERDDLQNVKQQQAILMNLWEALLPGGILVYTTCSLLPEENDKQIERLLSSHLDAELIPVENNTLLHAHYGGYRFNRYSRDAIYVALIKKSVNS